MTDAPTPRVLKAADKWERARGKAVLFGATLNDRERYGIRCEQLAVAVRQWRKKQRDVSHSD